MGLIIFEVYASILMNFLYSVYLFCAKCLQKRGICGGSVYVVTCIWHCPIVCVVCVWFSCCPRNTNFAWWLIRPIKLCLPDIVQQDICIKYWFTSSHIVVGSSRNIFTCNKEYITSLVTNNSQWNKDYPKFSL